MLTSTNFPRRLGDFSNTTDVKEMKKMWNKLMVFVLMFS